MAWKKEDGAPKANDGGVAVMDQLEPVEKVQKPMTPRNARKVMLYSIHPEVWIGLSSGSKILKELNNGKNMFIDNPDERHFHIQFHKHKCLVDPVYLPTLRKHDGYRIEFVEAIASNDGDPKAISLEEMMDTGAGEGFIRVLEDKDFQTGDAKWAPWNSFAIAKDIKLLRMTADYYEIKDEQGPEKAKAFWLKRSKLPEPK